MFTRQNPTETKNPINYACLPSLARFIRIRIAIAFLIFLKRIPLRNTLLIAITLCSGYSSAYGGSLGKARFRWEPVNDPRVSGYELHWGKETGIYTHSHNVGNATEVVIEDFTEGVEYFASVTAYDGLGVESDYSVEISFVYDSVDKIILLEAEEGELSPQMTVSGDGAILWVTAYPSDPDASVELKFSVPFAAEYYVWCRVFAPAASTDSFFISFDQGMEEVYYVYGEETPPAQAIVPDWTWSRIQISTTNPRVFGLEFGPHILRFRNRENVILDRIVIASNPDFIPTDLLPRSGDYIEVMRQPKDAAIAEGENVVIDASFISTGPLNLQWFHNGDVIENALQSSLNLMNVDSQVSGEYTLSARCRTTSNSTRTAILTVYTNLTDSSFRVMSVNYLESGQVEFHITGSIGTAIEVYASNDLLTWNLITVQSKVGNIISINDSEAGVRTQRFYRLADKISP